jgi:hypothetical protein
MACSRTVALAREDREIVLGVRRLRVRGDARPPVYFDGLEPH